jgi:hypothetical protein
MINKGVAPTKYAQPAYIDKYEFRCPGCRNHVLIAADVPSVYVSHHDVVETPGYSGLTDREKRHTAMNLIEAAHNERAYALSGNVRINYLIERHSDEDSSCRYSGRLAFHVEPGGQVVRDIHDIEFRDALDKARAL